MDSKSQIQQKVEEILNSLDNLAPAAPAPFFYTRVEARLMREESNFWERASRFLTTPAIAFFSVGFVLAVNTLVFVRYSSNDELSQDQQEIAAVDEYNRTTSVLNYNIDNTINPDE